MERSRFDRQFSMRAAVIFVLTLLLFELPHWSVDTHAGTSQRQVTAPKPGVVVPAPPSTLSRIAFNLTGVWRCDDGGTYFVRQVNNELWWYGRDPGMNWTNVFHGQIQGTTVTGNWADVPQGKVQSSGTLNLQIFPANRMVATSKTGFFGGSQWTR
jgi:hypothetical protein